MLSVPMVMLLLLPVQAPAEQPAARPKTRTTSAATSADIEAMRRDIQALASQVAGLRAVLSERPKEDVAAFNANVARLQLVNQELERLRKLRDDVKARLRTAQSSEDDARYRLSNIQNELLYATGIDRQANEDRIRRDLERQIEDAQAAQGEASQQLSDIDLRVTQTEQIAERLRRKLKIDYTQVDETDDVEGPQKTPPETPATEPSEGRPDE